MYNSNYSFNIPHITKAVKWIIVVNVFVFIITLFSGYIEFIHIFGLIPARIIHYFTIWQMITYMFLHANLLHLVLNMLMLWFFGCGLEAIWGSKRFLKYYFLTGIGAGICSIITSFDSFVPIIGASGAIFGILVAYALVFPETVVFVFFVFPVKIKYAVLIFGAINLFGAFNNTGSNIAYFAHIGGGLTGYLYLKREKLLYEVYNYYISLKNKRHEQKKIENQNLNKKTDEILDKISKHGMDSLTKKEKKILYKKSKLS